MHFTECSRTCVGDLFIYLDIFIQGSTFRIEYSVFQSGHAKINIGLHCHNHTFNS